MEKLAATEKEVWGEKQRSFGSVTGEKGRIDRRAGEKEGTLHSGVSGVAMKSRKGGLKRKKKERSRSDINSVCIAIAGKMKEKRYGGNYGEMSAGGGEKA